MPRNPTIHLNGTSERNLKEGYNAAADALEDFIERWGAVEFNARDYYVQDGWPTADTAYSEAREERDEMGAHIRAVQDYLQRIRESLYDQKP